MLIKTHFPDACGTGWAREEFAEIHFGDKRLNQRFISVTEDLAMHTLSPINQACEDWAQTKAAYRLFDNEKIVAEHITEIHTENTARRMQGHPVVLAVQDTCYFNYTHHPSVKGLGLIGTNRKPSQGLIMHSTMALTPQGMPLGLLTQKIWARDEERKNIARQRKERQIEDKESFKWLEALEKTVQLAPQEVRVVTVCDREADIYELFMKADELNTEVLVRAAQNRRCNEELPKLWEFMESRSLAKRLTIEVPAKKKEPARKAVVEIRFAPVHLRPPHSHNKGKQKEILVYAVFLREVDPPEKATPLEWMLLTNGEVKTLKEALTCIDWYRVRWHIETYHKVLKSGCKVEDCRLETAERLKRYLALFSIIAWRLYRITHMNRQHPEASCEMILAEHEWKALYLKIHRTTAFPDTPPTIRQAVRWIGQLGGFLGRKGDGEPGITVIWRGWQRLQDIAETWQLVQHA